MVNSSNIQTLTIKNLGFKYKNSSQIFNNISFEVKSGDILSLLGPNGCGKTTLLNCIVNLLSPNNGDILINGINTKKLNSRKIAQSLGYVPQVITACFDYSVLDYVVCGCAPYLKLFDKPGDAEYDVAYDALSQMKIDYLSDKSYAQISGGEQQQVCIARVLAQKPSFILLDEPTSHLDFGNQMRTMRIVKKMAKQGFGIIMTTHNPDQALMMDGYTLMMKSRDNYIYGKTKDIVTEKSLRDLYAIDLFLEDSKHTNRKICVSADI